MTDKKSDQSPEVAKLKGILKNQIIEIQELKQKLIKFANKKNQAGVKEVEAAYQKSIENLKDKHLENLQAKDNIIVALKKDLKSSQREIEAHLKRHNDDMKNLNYSMMNERYSRDFLVSQLTQELIISLKSNHQGTVTKADKSSEEKDIEQTKLLRPKIEKVHLPDSAPIDKSEKLYILYIAPTVPNFDESSGGKRAYHMLRLLAEKHNVYCYSKVLGKQTHKDILESIGVKVFSHVNPNHFIEKVKNVDVIIAAWYYSYFSNAELINHFSNAKLIIDTVDIHWVREERSLASWDGITIAKQQENMVNEINVYSKADIIWVVSMEDKNAVLEELPEADVRIVSNIHTMKVDTFIKDKPNNILFFGGYNHYPNINAVKILAKQIFPKIRKQVPDAQLIIAGSNAPADVEELGSLEGVDFRGFINFADIIKLYNDSKLTLVPLTEGAGIKGKICESIEYRTAVVTNSIGNEGINLETGIDGFVSDNENDLVRYSVDILSGKVDLESITLKAQEKVKEILGPETNMKVMEESFVPVVDICIVTYNKVDLLKTCIDSINKNTLYQHYNIIVYSNGCTDGTVAYLKKLTEQQKNVQIILSDTNDVFVKPNNEMMLLNPTHDVVLVNNDVQVTESWLQALVEEAYKSKSIGIVGSKILYPDNVLQEFGSELYSNGSGMNIGKHGNPNDEQFMYSRKASYVSGCSMYIKRSTILKLGVFDELFHPCYAEDSDYCYSAWKKGIEVNVTPKSIIYHMEGASSGTDTSKGFKKFQNINIQKFLSKHANAVDAINQKVHDINSEYHLLK